MEYQYHANKESREQKAGHRKPGSPSYLLCGTMVDHRICQAGRHLMQSPSLPLVPSAVSSEAQLMRTPGVLQACSKQYQATCHRDASRVASCYLLHTRLTQQSAVGHGNQFFSSWLFWALSCHVQRAFNLAHWFSGSLREGEWIPAQRPLGGELLSFTSPISMPSEENSAVAEVLSPSSTFH